MPEKICSEAKNNAKKNDQINTGSRLYTLKRLLHSPVMLSTIKQIQ